MDMYVHLHVSPDFTDVINYIKPNTDGALSLEAILVSAFERCAHLIPT
jgi:hypothetical protein